MRAHTLKCLNPPKPGFSFAITNALTNNTIIYSSIRKGVKAIGWDQGYIINRLKKNSTKLYLNRYLMTIYKND